jgi:hypothetical protein
MSRNFHPDVWCCWASCAGMSGRQNCCFLKGVAVEIVDGLFPQHLSARILFHFIPYFFTTLPI